MKDTIPRSILIYGLLMMLFGFLGYLQGSATSLYAGTGTGFLVVISSLFARKKAGAYTALALTCVLTIVLTCRYIATSKTMPALLALLSAAMLVYLLLQLTKWKKA